MLISLLYVKAHMIFKETPAIVFAGMNILSLQNWGYWSGIVLFNERLKAYMWVGLITGGSGIVLSEGNDVRESYDSPL